MSFKDEKIKELEHEIKRLRNYRVGQMFKRLSKGQIYLIAVLITYFFVIGVFVHIGFIFEFIRR